MRTFDLGPFHGLVSQADPRYIGANSAQDLLNVALEDGSLRPRYGYRNVASAQSGHSANFGCVFLNGYNSSNTQVEEYITFETVSSNTRAYYRNATNGSATQISASARNASPWTGFSFDQYGYLINPNESTPVFRRTIGSASSFVALQQPTTPTVGAGLEIVYQSTSGLQYPTMNWAGTDAADVTVTGSATTTSLTVNSDNSLTIQHSASSRLASSFEVDMNAITAGVQNWQYNDIFAFTLTCSTTAFDIDPNTVQVLFTNNDGSPVSFAPVKINVYQNPVLLQNKQYVVRAEFTGKTRASWDNIRRIKVSYTVTVSSGTASNNRLTISPITVGCCNLKFPAERTPGQLAYFGYSYYFSGSDMESGVGGISGIGNNALLGYFPVQALDGVDGLGCWLKITATTSGDSNVDNNRFYFADGQTFRLLATQTDATPTYLLQMSATEILNITATYSAKPFKFTRCTGGFPFKAWVVWLYQNEGLSNVRHSRIGEPEKQADSSLPGILNEEDDLNRGATFTLADDGGDFPVTGLEAGDACLLFGAEGVYAQVGDTPSTLTPPKKLPGSIGIANKFAACRMRTDQGATGAAYVARDGSGVYFVLVNTAFDGDQGFQIVELTEAIRPEIQNFLITGGGYTLAQFQSKVRIWADESTQSLWVACGSRVLVLRRPGPDGQRSWEKYRYDTNSAEIAYPVASFVSGVNRFVVRALMSDGTFAEFEYNSNTGAFITGASRDAGRTMPTPYWRSKKFTGQNRYIRRVGFFREDASETPSATIVSSRQTATYTVAANKVFAKVSPLQSGWEHDFQINLTETMDPIDRVEIQEVPVSRGNHR